MFIFVAKSKIPKNIWKLITNREKTIEKFKLKNEEKIKNSIVFPKIEKKMDKMIEPNF